MRRRAKASGSVVAAAAAVADFDCDYCCYSSCGRVRCHLVDLEPYRGECAFDHPAQDRVPDRQTCDSEAQVHYPGGCALEVGPSGRCSCEAEDVAIVVAGEVVQVVMWADRGDYPLLRRPWANPLALSSWVNTVPVRDPNRLDHPAWENSCHVDHWVRDRP